MEENDILRECNTCYPFYIYICIYIFYFTFLSSLLINLYFLRDRVTFLLINHVNCLISSVNYSALEEK